MDLKVRLAQARRNVVNCVCMLADQRARREKLRFAGHPTDLADECLQVLEQTLAAMVHHRDLLEAEAQKRPLVLDLVARPNRWPHYPPARHISGSVERHPL